MKTCWAEQNIIKLKTFHKYFSLVQVGAHTDLTVSKSIIKLREGQLGREPCTDYGYDGYLNCLQNEIRFVMNKL